MDIQDILFNIDLPRSLKDAVLDFMESHRISDPSMKVLVPTESNDDINGSQHATGGGTDFTYQDASESDLREATSLGYYEYFADYFGYYTGHYYNGGPEKFAAIVVDPPAYAIELTI